MPEEKDVRKERLIDYVLYILLLSMIFVTLFFCCILSGDNNTQSVHLESFRDMLTALVTSEAAIFAIVISLSLIAIQLATSSYSVRIIDIFLEDSYFRNTFYIYIFAILCELFLLMTLKYKLLEPYINILSAISYIFGIILLYLLMLYIENIMSLLKPNRIIDRLEQSANSWTISRDDQPGGEHDLLLPITDIVISALKRYDESTLRYGLETIKELIIHMINDRNPEVKRYKIKSFVFYHFRLITRLAIEKKDENTINKLFFELGNIGEEAIRKDLEEIALDAIDFLKEFGKMAANENFKLVVSEIASPIEKIGLSAIERKTHEIPADRKHTLGNIAYNSTNSLEDVSISGIQNEIEAGAWYSAYALGRIGESAAKQEFERVASGASGSLGSIGERIIQHLGENIGRRHSNESITLRERKATIESIVDMIADTLGKVGVASAKKKLGGPASISATGLCSMGREAIDKNLENYVVDQIRQSLQDIQSASSELPELKETSQVCEMHLDFLDSRLRSDRKETSD